MNRIARTVTERPAPGLGLGRSLLALAACLALAVPVGFGLPQGRPGQGSAGAGPAASEALKDLLATARFEVASIKPLKPGERTRFANIGTRPTDPRFYDGGINMRMLLRRAYGIQDAQIVGGPAWIRSERFDIEATAPDSVAAAMRKLSPGEAKLVKQRMIQRLLGDRFNLKVHQEMRVLPVYVLVVAKHGPKLEGVATGSGGTTRQGIRKKSTPFVQPQHGETAMFASFAPVSSLTALLSQQLGRPVLDETGLKGRYAFELHYMPGPGECGPFGCTPGSGSGLMGERPQAPGASDSSGPSIFTALEQQLGLELKRGKGPVQVLVIDHIEQPTPN